MKDANDAAKWGTSDPDNLSRPEVMPDSIVNDLRFLDPVQDKLEEACPRVFQATDVPGEKAKRKKARGGLASATRSDGYVLISLVLPYKQNERCIYHWMLLVACKIRYHNKYATIDIACRMKPWVPRIDGYAVALQQHLQEAAADCPEGRSLRSAVAYWAKLHLIADTDTDASWLETHLNNAHQAAHGLGLMLERHEVARIWRGMIFLLEVYGGIDCDNNGMVILHSAHVLLPPPPPPPSSSSPPHATHI
jgi:hypothetical protein